MVVSTTSICRIGPYASEIPRKNRDKISASHWFKLRQTVIPADPSYEKHARAREIVHSACTEGSTTVFSVCDSSSHKLFIALYECNGTVVLPPALGKVVHHSNRENSHENNASPVHRLCSHRRGSWPESKEPEWKDEEHGHDVDCQSGPTERPSPRWQRSSVKTSPDQASDDDQVGAENGDRAKRRNGSQSCGRSEVDAGEC